MCRRRSKQSCGAASAFRDGSTRLEGWWTLERRRRAGASVRRPRSQLRPRPATAELSQITPMNRTGSTASHTLASAGVASAEQAEAQARPRLRLPQSAATCARCQPRVIVRASVMRSIAVRINLDSGWSLEQSAAKESPRHSAGGLSGFECCGQALNNSTPAAFSSPTVSSALTGR